MTNCLWETAIERIGVLTAPLALDELPDAELLKRFVIAHEEFAFAAIVRRHGSLVWAVCQSQCRRRPTPKTRSRRRSWYSFDRQRRCESRMRSVAAYSRGSRVSKRFAIAATPQAARAGGGDF